MSESNDQPKRAETTERERLLLAALRAAWQELNTIRAREGVPHHRDDGMPYCTEDWWAELTECCAFAIEHVSGEPPKPWPFKWENQHGDF